MANIDGTGTTPAPTTLGHAQTMEFFEGWSRLEDASKAASNEVDTAASDECAQIVASSAESSNLSG